MRTESISRVARPVRACLSGEDLDWLGGRSVCVALDLCTTVELAESGGNTEWSAEIWTFLKERIPALPPEPPPVRVTSRAPLASGLSSSTALILGLFAVFVPAASGISRDQVIQWAYEFEFAICNGGGMDHLAIALGGVTLFHGRPAGLPEVGGRIGLPAEWSVVVIDSGTPKSTPDHIRSVRAQCAAGDPVLAEYLARSDDASGVVWKGIQEEDLEMVSTGMAAAHEAMRDCQQMSTPLLEQLRVRAYQTAGMTLKVSGAGGGGALVGVCATADVPALTSALRAAYQQSYPGVQVLVAAPAPSLS
ncbi:galactokinase [Amycolatopsis sulphurea]|uniref:Galactokinase n=1 Tax=Amycolatopsis sulphurea TaxID=76022 RepID=A0A2A9FHF9_9PSEU|nr:galactokinase [Amycolatopsis sulphurea]